MTLDEYAALAREVRELIDIDVPVCTSKEAFKHHRRLAVIGLADAVLDLVERVRMQDHQLSSYRMMDINKKNIISRQSKKLGDDARIDTAARQTLSSERDANSMLTEENDKLRERVRKLQVSLDLQWNSALRAIKQWQAAHPDKANIWPDHKELLLWLMEEVKNEREACAAHITSIGMPLLAGRISQGEHRK